MKNGFVGNRWAVAGFDYDTAKALITAIEHSAIDKDILRRKHTKHEIETKFTDGTILRWVRETELCRGFKFNKMWCDKNIDKEVLRTAILSRYLGRVEDINWV